MNLATLEQFASGDKVPTQAHLRAVLPNNHAGGLIGFRGNTARHIQQTYDMLIQIYPIEGANWGRVISTRGQPEQLSKAWYECAINLLQSYPLYYDHAGFNLNFIFPTDLVDLILSRGDIERIAKSSKTKILVKHACLMRSTERVIQVRTNDLEAKSIKCFEAAVYLLAVIVQDNITVALSAPGNIFYTELVTDNIIRYVNHFDEEDVLFDFTKGREMNNESDISTTVDDINIDDNSDIEI